MNRYVLDGITADVRAGKKVGLLSPKMAYSVSCFRDVLRRLPKDLDSARHVCGDEHATFKSGGSLRVLPGGDLSREWPMDVLVILEWNHVSDDITALVDETWRSNGINEIIRL